MALIARIKSVDYVLTTTDAGGATSSTDLSLSGELVVVAEYLDDAAPTVILLTQTFQVSSAESETQITDRIIALGTKMQDARTRTAGLKTKTGAKIKIP
ncbi:MAG: hypothetical protein ACR2M1_12400 [Gemmatimonadaceae bacterium]